MNIADNIQIFRLVHPSGAYIEVSNFGAMWLSAYMPDTAGHLADVLLGYPTMEGFLQDTNYMGRTIGRFANRIKNASFEADGKCYVLDANDGANCNHSGATGLHQHIFEVVAQSANSVTFSFVSPDGEGGFPGEVHLQVSYTLTEDLAVQIDYHATTTKRTVLSITNHAYFNLDAEGSVLNHHLQIYPAQLLEANEQYIPSGKILSAEGTAFDFSLPKSIGRDIDPSNEQFIWNRGYNHCYLFPAKGLKPMAKLSSPRSGRSVTLYSTLPAMQVYTGGFLGSTVAGKFGRLVQPSDGVALEAQFCPDSPNRPEFPSCWLNPDEDYKHQIVYSFRNQ